MLRAIPLTALPLIAYNLIGYGLSGADPWASRLFAITMLSGASWTLTLGDLLVIFALSVLFVEVMRTAQAGRLVSTHVLATIVAAVYVVEFIAAVIAAHSVFFILTAIAAFDAVAGFAIAPREGERDVAFEEDVEGV